MDPPGPDTNPAYQVLIPDGILSLLALCLCGARIYTYHRWLSKLTHDDYLIVVAQVDLS
jgi:hypothetical protein